MPAAYKSPTSQPREASAQRSLQEDREWLRVTNTCWSHNRHKSKYKSNSRKLLKLSFEGSDLFLKLLKPLVDRDFELCEHLVELLVFVFVS